MKKTLDARGLSCPEPVLMLKRVIGSETEIELLADNQACVENCTRFAEAKGFHVSASGGRGEYILNIKRN